MQEVERWFSPDIPRYSERLQRNSLQSAHGGDDIHGLPGISVEVKRHETLHIDAWWRQCTEQAARDGLMPVLVYRQSRQPWNVRTWLQLTDGNGISHFVVASYPLAEFLIWYSKFYHQHLLTLMPNQNT